MQRISVSEIAAALGADVLGDGSIEVVRAAEPADAGPEDLALAMNPKYADGLSKGRARAAVLWKDADWQALGLEAAIRVPRAEVAMSAATRRFDPGPAIAPGIHPSAAVDPGADIGEGAAIGPFVAIGAGARIGPGARIASHASVAEGARIGSDALILQGARIGRNAAIGDRFVGQPGCVVGSDGFSFVTAGKSRAEAARETMGDASGAALGQPWLRIHSLGSVAVGDDVEIGANSCVDSGTVRPTRIGGGTKMDNLVHIAHNCEIGRDCLFAGQVGIAGSAVIGDNVILGGQVGVADNISLGDGVVAGGASAILSNVPAGRVVLGYPAVRMKTHVEIYKALRRLPRLAADVAALKKPVPNPPGRD